MASHVTTFVYDAAGQLLLKNNGNNQTPGSHEIDRYAYDSQGRLVRSEDGRGDVTRRVYDAAGNLVKLIDPAGNATTYVYDGLDRKISETTAGVPRQFFYDGNGNLLYSVDRNGRAIKSAYTRDDQVSATWEYLDLTQAQMPAPGSQQFIAFTNSYYDAFGRLEEERYSRRNDYSQTSGLEYRVTDSYKYDGLDRLIEHSNQSIQTTSPLHSLNVPVLKQTYAYAYDSSGLVETREQFIAGQFAASTKSTYNAFGELVRQEDKETNAASVASSILDFESTDAVFSYLGDGSLASTTRYTDWDPALPGGAGHRNRVKTTYAYDGAGRIKNIAHSQARRTTATWPGVDTNLVDFAYGYDLADRINSQGTNWNQSLAAFASRTDETQAFAFDTAGQLLNADSNLANRDSTYAYGVNGNRTSATEPGAGATVYAPPGANNRVSQDSTYRYVYDFEGNLTERRLLAGDVLDQTYSWDHRNRLTKVERYVNATLAETVAYRYNAGDDPIYRSVTPAGQSSQVEHYLVESGQRTLAFETDGDVLCRYQYGPTGEAIFDQSFSGYGNPTLQSEADLRLPLGDHQHSTRVVMGHYRLTDDSIYIRQSVDYDPFGRVRSVVRENAQPPLPLPIDDLDTVFAHHGSIIDPSAELYLKDQRWYSPDLGRFISEDPIQDGSNWYAFAGNDPVNFADPSGLSQQGHPLNGGYSGNATREPTMKSGFLPGFNLVDTATAAYRGAKAIAPYVNSAINAGARALASTLVASPPPVRRGVTLPLAPEAEEAVVRQITPGSAIVPRSIADLPGVRGALQDPGRYVIRNHNDIGYEVLNPDGSVRFIGDSNYLPIAENYRRAHAAAQADAFRARAIDLYGEALISLNPFLETTRDGLIAGFGYDFYNPNQQQTSDDRHTAGQMLFLPGFNSKQVKYADEALDALQDYRRARNQADAVAQDLLEQQGMRETRSVPGVRPGSNGKLDHRDKITELEQQARLEAGPGETVLIQRQVQKYGSKRIPDVQIVDPSGRTRKIFEAERLPNSQRNLNRESEYRRLGIPFETHELD